VELIEAGLVSTAHDVSDGGLAVALAEMSLAGKGIGCEVSIDFDGRADCALFGESGCRILVAVDANKTDDVEAAADIRRVRARLLGFTGGDALIVRQRGKDEPLIDVKIAALRQRWQARLSDIADGRDHHA